MQFKLVKRSYISFGENNDSASLSFSYLFHSHFYLIMNEMDNIFDMEEKS